MYTFSLIICCTSVITVVEDVAESLPLVGEMPTTIVAENNELAITAVAPSPSTFQGVSFEVNFDNDGTIRDAGASLSVSTEAPASLSIPQTLLDDLGIDPADLTDDFRVGFSVFRDDSLFQPRSREEQTNSQTMTAIGSSVISAQISGLGEVVVDNLDTPITVELNVKPVCYGYMIIL